MQAQLQVAVLWAVPYCHSSSAHQSPPFQLACCRVVQAQLQAAVLVGNSPPPPPPSGGNDNKLSGGAIAGIVIGCVAGVALFAVLA